MFFRCSSASNELDICVQGKLASLIGVKSISDNILVFGKSIDEHNAHLGALLIKLLEAGLTINRKICVIGVKEVSFFGHWVSVAGVRPMIKDTLREIQRPRTKSEV